MKKQIDADDQLILGTLATCVVVAFIGLNQARFEQVCSDSIYDHQRHAAAHSYQNPNVANQSPAIGAIPVSLGQSDKSNNDPCQNTWSIVWPWAWPRSDVWQAIFDFLLVVVGWRTLGVYDRQRRIMGDQNTLMKRQADISEQAMTIGQWPYLFVDSHEFFTPFGVDPRGSPVPIFDFAIKVHGGSPAILRRFYESLNYELSVLPPPSRDDLGWAIIDAPVLPGETWPRQSAYTGDPAILKAPGNGRRKFFFIGAFVYDDLFGNQHEMGFCYVSGRYGGPGMIYGGAEYNYHNIRKPEDRI